MTPFNIALIGECMIELQEISPGEVQQTFGGDTLNTAVYMARIAKGLPINVDYVTAVGTDPFSEAMIRFWEKENVGSSMIQRIDGKRPGLYYIQLDENGERFFHYWRSEAAARGCFEYPGSDAILERLGNYDAVYLSGISLAILLPESLKLILSRLTALKKKGTPIFFDCNYRPHLWSQVNIAVRAYKQMFSLAHTVLLNHEEGKTLLGCSSENEIHKCLRALGVTESVVRNGAAPCSLCWKDSIISVPSLKIGRVIDTTAAGDSFSAAYLLARRSSLPPQDAAQFAHRLAAHVISHKGAIVPETGTPILMDLAIPKY